MQIIRAVLFSIALLGAAQAQAQTSPCKRTDNAPQRITLNFSNVVVPPDASLGDVIAETSVTSLNKTYYYNRCVGDGKEHLEGVYTGITSTPTDYETYSTGVDGLGIRLAVGRNGSFDNFGLGNLKHVIYPVNGDISLDSYEVKAQLVKTKQMVSNGMLGELSNAGGEIYLTGRVTDDKPMVVIDVSGSATAVVVNPSCSLTSGDNNRDMSVTLKSATLNAFNRIGATSGDTNFNFRLKCGGGSDDYRIKVNTRFTPGAEGSIDLSKGVLGNGANEKEAARDIGIQVLASDVPLVFEHKYVMGELGADSTEYTMAMTARYYQYGKRPTAGSVVSHMVYNIDYN